MAIYRGPGGSGDAVNDSSSETRLAVEARDAAIAAQAAAEAAQVAAELAETNAETAETNAETAETNAETAATNAASSASAASTSASNASSSASSASTSATNAASSASAASSSASAASNSATNAATSATNAANSATAAATSATNASNSATAAASSASSASSSASTATTKASEASTSATNAASSATSAASSASTATTQAGIATTQATNAASSASAASTSASNASTSATNASNSASAASTSATNAANSATASASSASSSQAAADAALAALDSFDDRYLGQKSTAPTVDNDGNALVTGALYFDTVSNAMKVWDGSSWLSAYASLSGALLATNNLSDLSSASTARTNLGLGTAATTAATDYATAAQGAKSDTALQPAAIGVSVQGYDADTAKLDVSQSWSAAQSFNAGVTLGDASGDALTINSSAVSIPNGLNFSSGNLGIGSTISSWGANYRVMQLGASGSIFGRSTAFQTGIYDNIYAVGSTFTYVASTYATGYLQTSGQHQWFNAPSGTAGNTATFTQAMTLDASGNLGIGTSSPDASYRVDIQAATAGARVKSSTGTNIAFLTLNNTGSDMYVGREGSAGGVLATGTSAYSGVVTVNGAYPLAFGTNGAERMRIDSSGNVGIGTSSPGSKLDVSGLARANAFGMNATGGTPATGIAAPASDTLGLYTNTVERMRITSTGDVGIGTSSPGYKLEVYGASNASQGWNSGGSVTGFAQANTSNSDFRFGTITNHNLNFYTNSTSKMLLDSSGNLGLGVTPSAWGSTFRAYQTGIGSAFYGRTNYGPQVGMSANFLNNGSALVYIGNGYASRYEQNDGAHAWYTAPSGTAGNAITFTQAMTLDASGNLGIGTSSPSYRLHVANSSADPYILIDGSSGLRDCGLMLKASATITALRADSANNLFVAERMRIDSSGNFLTYCQGTSPGMKPAYDCRAWVNFNGTGTVAIRASGNVSSITDNGTGYYTVNLTTAMPDINYVANVSPSPTSGGTGIVANMFTNTGNPEAPTTSAFKMAFFARPDGSNVDAPYVSVAVHR